LFEVIGMPNMDFKKGYKELYFPPEKPVLVDVPPMRFLMIEGEGDPNGSPDFQNAVSALYSMAYTLKMLPKKGAAPQGYFEYSVAPLEGLWWLSDGTFSFKGRDNWLWTAMIRQPDFVTAELVLEQLPGLMRKKPNPALERMRFETFAEGLCVQIMHIGPYSEEPANIARMEEFMRENGFVSRIGSGGKHHEIYLADPRKIKPEKMKTVVRHPVSRQ
jgi:hypothetical protein